MPYSNMDKFYAAAQVKMKKTGEIMLAAKAWNGRVVCSWLADTMVLACAGADPGFDEGRLFLESHAAMLSDQISVLD